MIVDTAIGLFGAECGIECSPSSSCSLHVSKFYQLNFFRTYLSNSDSKLLCLYTENTDLELITADTAV